MNVRVIDVAASSPMRSKRRFWWHFAEMVVVMLLSMAVLGAAVSAIFAVAGHANLLHYSALRGLLMTAYMVIGMALWMRYRRHVWARVAEMGAAMAVPYVVLVGPLLTGLIGESLFLAAMHALMLPSMYVAMALRRDEYEGDHREHGQSPQEHAPHITRRDRHGNDARSGHGVPRQPQDRRHGRVEGSEGPRRERRVPAAP